MSISFKNFAPSSFFHTTQAGNAGKTERTGASETGKAESGQRPKAGGSFFGRHFNPAKLAGTFGSFGKQQTQADSELRQAASAMASKLAGFAEFHMNAKEVGKVASAIRKQLTPEQRQTLDSALNLAQKLGSKAGVESLKLSIYMESLAKGKISKEMCMQGIQKTYDKLLGMNSQGMNDKDQFKALGELCLTLMKSLPSGGQARRIALEKYDAAVALNSPRALHGLATLLNNANGVNLQELHRFNPQAYAASRPQAESAQRPQSRPHPGFTPRPQAQSAQHPGAAPRPQAQSTQRPGTAPRPQAQSTQRPGTAPRPQAESTQRPQSPPRPQATPAAHTAAAPEKNAAPAVPFSAAPIRMTAALADKGALADMSTVAEQLRQGGFDAQRLRELRKDIQGLRGNGDTAANVDNFKQKYRNVLNFDKDANATGVGFARLLAGINVNLKKHGEGTHA